MVVYEVVAQGRWSLTRNGRYERVDCTLNSLIATQISKGPRPLFRPDIRHILLFSVSGKRPPNIFAYDLSK